MESIIETNAQLIGFRFYIDSTSILYIRGRIEHFILYEFHSFSWTFWYNWKLLLRDCYM